MLSLVFMLADAEAKGLVYIFVLIPIILVGIAIVGAILFGIYVAIRFIIDLFRGEIGPEGSTESEGS